METFTLYEYKILSTVADGGHRYLTSEINYKGLTRKLVVFFERKKCETNLTENAILNIQGKLVDQGIHQSLILNDATLNYFQPLKDKEIIKLLKARDGIKTEIVLKNGKKMNVWNIAEGYDMGESFANLTTNISPSIDRTSIDLINTSEIDQIIDPLTKEVLFTIN